MHGLHRFHLQREPPNLPKKTAHAKHPKPPRPTWCFPFKPWPGRVETPQMLGQANQSGQTALFCILYGFVMFYGHLFMLFLALGTTVCTDFQSKAMHSDHSAVSYGGRRLAGKPSEWFNMANVGFVSTIWQILKSKTQLPKSTVLNHLQNTHDSNTRASQTLVTPWRTSKNIEILKTNSKPISGPRCNFRSDFTGLHDPILKMRRRLHRSGTTSWKWPKSL